MSMTTLKTETPPFHRKMMIMVAPNGARKTRDDHPALPLSPGELAICAAEIIEAGAAALHLHIRDANGRHSLRPDRYRQAIDAIRDQVGDKLVLQVTSEAVGLYTAAQQMDMVRQVRPEAVSLALKELCPTAQDIPAAARFFGWLRQESIWPQYILYTPAEVARFEKLRKQGVFGEEHPAVLYVLGRYQADLTGNPALLDLFLAESDAHTPWAACCFGGTELDCMLKAAELGGHARVGFENNLYLKDGRLAENNAGLVTQLVAEIAAFGRTAATADDIRNIFF